MVRSWAADPKIDHSHIKAACRADNQAWHFLNEMRNESNPLAVPIIITTGTIRTSEWTEQNGCQGFLHKPVEEEVLFRDVERCLGRL